MIDIRGIHDSMLTCGNYEKFMEYFLEDACKSFLKENYEEAINFGENDAITFSHLIKESNKELIKKIIRDFYMPKSGGL